MSKIMSKENKNGSLLDRITFSLITIGTLTLFGIALGSPFIFMGSEEIGYPFIIAFSGFGIYIAFKIFFNKPFPK